MYRSTGTIEIICDIIKSQIKWINFYTKWSNLRNVCWSIESIVSRVLKATAPGFSGDVRRSADSIVSAGFYE